MYVRPGGPQTVDSEVACVGLQTLCPCLSVLGVCYCWRARVGYDDALESGA